MAPFCKAVAVTRTSAPHRESNVLLTRIPEVYTGLTDSDWAIGSVSNGGYVLALILESCIQYQSKTEHVDPLHMTAHFLRSTLVGAFEVHIQTLKTGKGLTNIIAELTQEGITKVTTHAIFGVNGPSPSDPIQLSLPPTSRYARHIPIYSHPSNPPPAKPLRDTWKFKGHVQLVEDTETLLKNEPDSPTRTSRSTIGGGGLEWAAWFEFKDEEDNITNPAVAFLADVFLNIPTLLPRSEKPGLKISWFPTVTMSIEFKAPIPPLSSRHANRTVGLYSTGRFMGNPQAKHDAYMEVWTAPCNLGEGIPVEGWRDEQVCLAIATQMALMVPMEVNAKQGKGASKL